MAKGAKKQENNLNKDTKHSWVFDKKILFCMVIICAISVSLYYPTLNEKISEQKPTKTSTTQPETPKENTEKHSKIDSKTKQSSDISKIKNLRANSSSIQRKPGIHFLPFLHIIIFMFSNNFFHLFPCIRSAARSLN